MRKNTKHKNWVALTFPFNKAAPHISKKRRNTDIYVERKYISKPIHIKKLREMIVRNKTFTNKVKKSLNSLKTNGKFNPCYSRKNILSFKPS